MHEFHTRSIVKAITWRVIATLTTTALVYIYTGDFTLTLEVGFFDIVLKLFFYYGHERIWNKIKWGKKHLTPQAMTS